MEWRKSDLRSVPARLRLLVLPAALLLFAGCGRRGPLRLPEEEKAPAALEPKRGEAKKGTQ